MKTAVPFSLMVKPAGNACNMRCTYCYYITNQTSSAHFMSEETLEKMIQNYFESSPGPVFSFVWHGGEPTLCGISFFEKAVELQKKYLPEKCECWNNLQTNGLGLNEEWCSFLKKNHFDVGISIDGTKMIHDHYRSDTSGNPTYETIRKNISLLLRHGIRPDLLCTLNEESTKRPSSVYSSLKNLKTGWVQFIPVVNHDDKGNVSGESVRPEAFGHFLREIFREWVLKDLGAHDVQMFAELLNIYNGGTPGVCWLSETCGRAPVVEYDGSIYSCDHFVTPAHRIGNVHENSFTECMESDLQNSFACSKKDELSSRCLKCPWLSFCNGGCLKDRFRRDHENDLCEGYMMFYEYADPVFRRIIDLLHEHVKVEDIRKIIRREGLLSQ